VQDVTEVTLADAKEASAIKSYFRRHPLVRKAEVLQESGGKLLIQLFTDTTKIRSIVHTILKNKCFLARKVPLVDGWEVWTIAAPKKPAIRHALEDIKRLGEFRLLHIRKSTFDGFNFSAKQERTLMLAVSLGYYRWPRAVSLQELAERLGLSKATVAEHLRKAEAKVLDKEFRI
jgi:predicted DNA binding protein